MPLWQWLLDVALAAIALAVLYALGLVLRRRALARHGGTFELGLRVRSTRHGRGWLLGIGRYSEDTLEWFRVFSLSPRPRSVWQRDALVYEGRREPEGAEQVSLYADHVVVRCATPDGLLELAMAPSSLMGFQSWLEAGPPGASWDARRPQR